MNKVIEVYYHYTSFDQVHRKKIYLNISSIESFCDISGSSSFEYHSVKHAKDFCPYGMNVLIISVSGEYYFSHSTIDKFVGLSKEFSHIEDRFEILDL